MCVCVYVMCMLVQSIKLLLMCILLLLSLFGKAKNVLNTFSNINWIVYLFHFCNVISISFCFNVSLSELSNYLKELIFTGVSQKFCNIIITQGTIQQFWLLLPRSWRWWTILNCETPSLPDTLWICLYGLEHDLSIHSFRPTWLLRFLQLQ